MSREHAARECLRSIAFLLLGTTVGYFIYALLVVLPAYRNAAWLASVDSAWLRGLIVVIVLDVGKLVGLLPVAWVLAPILALRPWTSALTLSVSTFGLDLVIFFGLGQGQAMTPSTWALRFVGMLVLAWPQQRVLRRRRRPRTQ